MAAIASEHLAAAVVGHVNLRASGEPRRAPLKGNQECLHSCPLRKLQSCVHHGKKS